MGQKLKFILSDLHIGAGYANGGNHLEDFTVDEELVNFVHEIQRESKRDQCEIELIINGDFFEFLNLRCQLVELLHRHRRGRSEGDSSQLLQCQ